ncbi:MAG: hypothetical protein H7Z12_03325 [Rhodospirillaceae bacterium]|nr:hypothetical protein [Rhodospirillales bacterium]
MIPFIRNLLGVKTDQAVQGAVEALVRWDPASATEAELRGMEQHLDDLGMQVAQARVTLKREKDESDTINRLSQQRMAAAEQLQRQIDIESDAHRRAELERSLTTLVGLLEQMAPDMEREAQDAIDAHDFLQSLEATYAEAGDKLKTAKSQLDRAQRDMSRAGQQREVAERKAEAARQAAGLSHATNSLGVALKAMQDAAAKDLASAEAARAKATLLRPTRPEEDDPHIKAALDQARGATPAPTTLSERLQVIRSRQSTTA